MQKSPECSHINNRHYFVTCTRWNKTGKGILCIEQGKSGCQFLFYLQLLKVLTPWVFFFKFFGNTLLQPMGSIVLTATMIIPYHSFPYSMLSKSIDSSLQVKMPLWGASVLGRQFYLATLKMSLQPLQTCTTKKKYQLHRYSSPRIHPSVHPSILCILCIEQWKFHLSSFYLFTYL